MFRAPDLAHCVHGAGRRRPNLSLISATPAAPKLKQNPRYIPICALILSDMVLVRHPSGHLYRECVGLRWPALPSPTLLARGTAHLAYYIN